MYSPEIIERRLYQAKKAGLAFRRLPRDTSIDIAQKLERLRFGRDNKPLPDGHLIRPLNAQEQAHIESERLISKCDFEYWAVRYAQIEIDPGVGSGEIRVVGADELLGAIPNSQENKPPAFIGKIGPTPFMPSQARFLQLIGRRERECQEELAKYGFTEGIFSYAHKVRQVGITQIWLEMLLHRMNFWWGTRAHAASLDAIRVGEIFKRFHIMLDRLPFWQMPRIYPDVKDTEVGFEQPISSRFTVEAENAEQGIGTGSQNDFSAMTEVALWKYPGQIGFSYIPSLPKAISTFHVEESTSHVKGDEWNVATEGARHKRRGFELFVYVFIPWYMNFAKYRANVPDSWSPAEHTQRHAELIEKTSPEFFDGKTIRPNRSQLYWWESARARYVRAGELAAFLASYPATPEQSFQNLNQGALPVEFIEYMETRYKDPISYDVEIVA